MIYLFSVIAFLLLVGFILLNLSICRYFYQKIQEPGLRYFDIVAAVFGILSAFWLLLFLFLADEKFFLFSALSAVFFIGIISIYNYKVYAKHKECLLWWQKCSYFDKLLLIFLVIIAICIYYHNRSLYNILRLMSFNMFFIYALFLKQVKKQHKICSLFSNKYIKSIEIVIGNLFYYLCWGVMVSYIVSACVNIVSLYFNPQDLDGCIDTGICKEGFVFDDCGNGMSCTITKESCLKDNNIWLEDIRSCDIRHKVIEDMLGY